MRLLFMLLAYALAIPGTDRAGCALLLASVLPTRCSVLTYARPTRCPVLTYARTRKATVRSMKDAIRGSTTPRTHVMSITCSR
eukprot:2745265-Rhodomonas_salina.3